MTVQDYARVERALDIVERSSLRVNRAKFRRAIETFHRVCSTWNPAAKLMSACDVQTRFSHHVADSISLAPVCAELDRDGYTWVDIGSGAGFPAIPIALLLTNLHVLMLERSEKKCDFLRTVIDQLGLPSTTVHNTEFPNFPLPPGPLVYTARAVERPQDLHRSLARNLRPADVFLAQTTTPPETFRNGFCVNEIRDAFTGSGLRRGLLFTIRRQ